MEGTPSITPLYVCKGRVPCLFFQREGNWLCMRTQVLPLFFLKSVCIGMQPPPWKFLDLPLICRASKSTGGPLPEKVIWTQGSFGASNIFTSWTLLPDRYFFDGMLIWLKEVLQSSNSGRATQSWNRWMCKFITKIWINKYTEKKASEIKMMSIYFTIVRQREGFFPPLPAQRKDYSFFIHPTSWTFIWCKNHVFSMLYLIFHEVFVRQHTAYN